MLSATIGLVSLDDDELASTFGGEERFFGISIPPILTWGAKIVEVLISTPIPEASYAYAKVGVS